MSPPLNKQDNIYRSISCHQATKDDLLQAKEIDGSLATGDLIMDRVSKACLN
jgi:hypothetical protein